MGRIGRQSAYLWVYYAPISNLGLGATHWDKPLETETWCQLLSKHYEETTPSDFDTLRSGDPGRLFGPVHDARVAVTGLAAGEYRIEFWDTWGAGKIGERRLRVSGTLRLELPGLRRDLAVKLKRIG